MSSLFILSDDEESDYNGTEVQGEDKDIDSLFIENEAPSTNTPNVSKSIGNEVDSGNDGEDDERPLFISRPDRAVETLTSTMIKPVSTNLPYAFQRTIVRELLKEDALLILGRGLGIDQIAANLIHSLDLAGNSIPLPEENQDRRNSLVLVLGASDEDNERLEQNISQLTALDGFFNDVDDDDEPGADPMKHVAYTEPRQSRLQFITNETGLASERTRMYRAGGVFSITSRVLIVDMLRGFIDVPSISAVVVLNAHRATEESLEAFILRVLKQDNPWATIKALSDQPERFIRGFSPLAQMQKNLFVKKTRLWPRFHLKIKNALNGIPGSKEKVKGIPTVVELQCQLSPKMQQIQTSILELIGLCISDIKRKVTSVDMEDWKVENLLDQSSSSAFFDDLVQRQLSPIWHRIPPETRKMVADISALKALLQDLLTEDCISFYRQLEVLRMSKGPQTPWLVTEDASNLFEAAKSRIHERSNPKDPNSIRKVLEELPKWRELAVLVDEHLSSGRKGPLLIMCSSRRIKVQLRRYMCSLRDDRRQGNRQWTSNYLKRRFALYQLWREGTFQLKRKLQEQSKETTEGSAADSGRPSMHHNNKRRRIRGGGSLSTSSVHKTDEQIEQVEIEKLNNLVEEGEPTEEIPDLDDYQLPEGYEEEEDYGVFKFDELKLLDAVIIETYDSVLELDELSPSGIIMYQPNPEFFRTIEIYGRSCGVSPNVYLLYYGLSYEEQAFLAAVRKEKDAFSKLIKERAKMPMLLATTEDDQRGLKIIREANTRIAGGQISTNRYGKILVDVREFRAALPSILHSYGFQVYPTHLTVGDYVLSPHMVVERKSIPDLIKSFQDGRLLTQCEAMFRYYSYVVLLVEFEVGGFTFDPASDSPGAASANMATIKAASELRGKLSLLLLTFPKLKIIWSSSPRETARIFDELRGTNNKAGNKPPWAGEPDPEIAAAYGTSGVGDSTTGHQNHMAIDMLRDIPGVTAKNFPLIIAKVESLYDLCKMTTEELAEIVGTDPAREIMGFLEAEM